MQIILAGPGRAGLAVTLAARRAGHEVAGVLARSGAEAAAERLGTVALDWDDLLPAADLLIIAVRDDAIAEVAARVAPRAIGVLAAIHLSGSVGVSALAPLAEVGLAIGGFHPLQTLPDPEIGSERLAGSWAGIAAADQVLLARLEELTATLEMRHFVLEEAARPLYHAGAAAAANYLIGCLALAQRLFNASGVPWEAADPLVHAVVGNAMMLGPDDALTGPIARGDAITVARQRAAIRRAAPELEAPFSAMGLALADLADASAAVRSALE